MSWQRDGICKIRELLSILGTVPFSPAGKSLFSKKTLSLPQANMVLMLDGSTALGE